MLGGAAKHHAGCVYVLPSGSGITRWTSGPMSESSSSSTSRSDIEPSIHWPKAGTCLRQVAVAESSSLLWRVLGISMYRFTRTATIKLTAGVPEALKFGAQIVAHFHKNYSYDMKLGVEVYGEPKVYWYGDFESLDQAAERNAKLPGDKEYLSLLDSAKHMFVEGSVRDRLVRLID